MGISNRSRRIILSNEARLLKQLRLANGLSLRKAGELLGRSDSYVSHLETGRMDVPRGEKLQRLLNVYGGLKAKWFYERARAYAETKTVRERLSELIDRANENQARVLLFAVQGILAAG